jgi:molecular chaperone DnaK (HSP70)
VSLDELPPLELAALLDACRDAKERITPNTRKLNIDAPFSATIAVSDFYDAATPLVERTLEVMAPVLGRTGEEEAQAPLADVAGVYLVGGGSGLPLVPRLLRERFGRRVHRSPYPSASTAIGLAIAADETSGFTMTDRFSRSFGVFRERDGGHAMMFDPIVLPEMVLPDGKEIVVVRRYRAAHNVGHYRFAECATPDASETTEAAGELVPFGEVLFPFDPALRERGDLAEVAVTRRPGPEVEERYVIDGDGLVEVEIEDLDDGFRRTYRLGSA